MFLFDLQYGTFSSTVIYNDFADKVVQYFRFF